MFPYLLAIVCLLLLLILTIGVFLYASGIFEHVCCEIKRPPILWEASLYAYKLHDGPYAEAGYLFTEAYSVDSTCVQCAIKYESDPKEDGSIVPSVVGSLVPEANPECRTAFERAGFTITRLEPIKEALVASFPHFSFLSIHIGAARVQRNMKAYILEHNLNVDTFIELYDGHWIHYIGLLQDAEKFRLPASTDSPASSVVVLGDRDVEVDEADEDAGDNGDQTEVNDSPVETLTAKAELPNDNQPPTEFEPVATNGDYSDEFESEFEKITDTSEIPSS